MKSKGIKNLLIDLGGVLINLDRQRCIEHFQKLGLQNVDALLDIQNQDGLLMQQEKGLITPAEFRDGVRKMIGKAVSDKQIDAAWNSFLVDIPTQKLDRQETEYPPDRPTEQSVPKIWPTSPALHRHWQE